MTLDSQPRLRVYEWPNSNRFADIGVNSLVGKCTELAGTLMLNDLKCNWLLVCGYGSHVGERCQVLSSLGKCPLRHGELVPVLCCLYISTTQNRCECVYVSEQLGIN